MAQKISQGAPSERLIFDGLEFGGVLLNQIMKSQKEICISCYIFKLDRFGKEVFAALRERSEAGVKVRLVVDGYGSYDPVRLRRSDSPDCFEVKVYHPLPWPFTWKRLSVFSSLEAILGVWNNINRRNHQKLFIFDSSVALVGSRNVIKDSLEWRETSLLVTSTHVAYLKRIFEFVWARSRRSFWDGIPKVRFTKRMKFSSRVLTTHTFFLRQKRKRLILDKLRKARKFIYITTPYFFPSRRLLKLLILKLEQGVEVRLLFSEQSDVPISQWILHSFYEELLKAGAKIYEYRPRVLHAKEVIVENWASVGSSNLNRRSYVRDLEVDYVLTDRRHLKELVKNFEKDVLECREITAPFSNSFLKRMIARMLRFLAPTWF